MEKITVILKQHTRLIHFQHDQDGATLRASEVKPRLDRYILKKLGGGDYDEGVENARRNNWLVGNGEHGALNYQMRIIPVDEVEFSDIERGRNRNPLFFGNMNAAPEDKKRFSMTGELKMILIFKEHALGNNVSLYDALRPIFNETIATFFFRNNFGARSSKGFGSFYISSDDSAYKDPQSSYSFSLSKGMELFNSIDLFWRSLRSGINTVGRNGTVFYFKSLAYMYCKDVLGGVWDKRKVKEYFLNAEAAIGKGIDIKDALGFSTNENWRSYQINIKKSVAENYQGDWRKAGNSNKKLPDRLQSPLLFKPIYDEQSGKCKVFLVFKEEEVKLNEFLDHKKICIEANRHHFLIDLPERFQLEDFFKYVVKIDIANHVEAQYHAHPNFEILDNIYNQFK